MRHPSTQLFYSSDRSEPIRVLLVNDNPSDRRLVQEALQEAGSSTQLTSLDRASLALKYLNKEEPFRNAAEPDVILVDSELIDMDWHEFMMKIKSDPRTSKIPAILLSASDGERDIKEAQNLQVAGYFVKPAFVTDFVNLIQQLDKRWNEFTKFRRERSQ